MLFQFPTENEIAYHYPDADKFEECLENARADPDEHYQLAARLKSIYQWIVLAEQFDENPHDKIETLLDDSSVYHPSISAASALTRWETDQEYQEAVAALHLLEDTFNEAHAEEWHEIADHVLTWMAKVRSELNRDIAPVIDETVQYIEDHFVDATDLPLNTYSGLISTVLDHHEAAVDSDILRAFVVTIQHANRYADQDQPIQERMLLEDALELAKVSDIHRDDVERRYAETYRKQAALQSDPVVSGEALREGLEDSTVSSTLSDAEKQDWKREMNEAFRTGASRLRREGTPLHTDEMDQAIWADVQRKSRVFQRIAVRYSRKAALYWFASHDGFFPPDDPNEQRLYELFSTVAPSDTGHVVEQPSEDEAEVSQSYLTYLSIYAPFTAQTLHRLIEDGVITRGFLYGIFLDCDQINDDDRWFVMKFIDAVFDERFDEAVHLGVPRFESMLFHILQSKGEDVDALMESGTGTRTLGSLLSVLKEYVDSRFHKYLTYMYNERLGQLAGGNIRNRIAHGHIRMGEDTAFLSYLMLTDMIRIVILTDFDSYRAEFGLISELELLDEFLE